MQTCRQILVTCQSASTMLVHLSFNNHPSTKCMWWQTEFSSWWREKYCSPIYCPGFLFCRHKQICVHRYDVRDECVKCPKSLHDKSLQDVAKCPKYCSCSRYALIVTKEKNVVLWQCPPLQRIIILDNIHINLDEIRFSEGKCIFLMHLKYKCWAKERSTTPDVTFKIYEIS